MNKLYSLLLQDNTVPAEYSWYAKRTEAVDTNERAEQLIAFITQDIPVARLALYASILCNLVLFTQYGAEIKALDPNNTYFSVTRDPDAGHSDTDYGMQDLIKPASAYKGLVQYLEDDISERLDTNSWFDLMGAACLQLLREVS